MSGNIIVGRTVVFKNLFIQFFSILIFVYLLNDNFEILFQVILCQIFRSLVVKDFYHESSLHNDYSYRE